jgi:hypothetical protein
MYEKLDYLPNNMYSSLLLTYFILDIKLIEEEFLPDEYEDTDPEDYDKNENIIYIKTLIDYVNTGKLNDKVIIDNEFISKSIEFVEGLSINIAILYLTLFENESKVSENIAIYGIGYEKLRDVRDIDGTFVDDYFNFIILLVDMCEYMIQNKTK